MIVLALKIRARAIANSQMPKWRARKDSRGVSIVRGPVSEMNRRRWGESVRQAATSSSLGEIVRRNKHHICTYQANTDSHNY